MKYELFIGLRYLQARRRETFISLITVISVLGVMIGVMTLNVVMSVMSGFEETLRDRLLGINAHIALVKSGDQLRDYENILRQVVKENGVVAASPTIYGQVMLTSGSRVSGVVVRGVDPDRVNAVVNLQSFIKEGNLAGLKSQHPIQVEDRTVLLPGIILGERLANQLGVFPGSPVQVVSPLGSPTAIGVIPKVRRFVVIGVLRTGMSEIDSTLVFMGLAEAQKFFELGDAVTNIEIRVQNVNRSREIADQIQRHFGFPYFAEDWTRLVAESILGAAIGKNRLFFGAAADGSDRRFQHRLHLGHGRDGEEKRYRDFAFHGRDPTEHPKNILAERVRYRGCRHGFGRGAWTGGLFPFGAVQI